MVNKCRLILSRIKQRTLVSILIRVLVSVAGIPKGQYKGYTCPRCQKAKVSAQHLRQKEKKKRNGSGANDRPLTGKDGLIGCLEQFRVSSNVKKQPIMAVSDLLEAILADCNADPATLQPLKNSFKKLLQIQRAFKVTT